MPLFVFDREDDVHYALRTVFTLSEEKTVTFRLSGLKHYLLYLDGAFLVGGPSRFAEAHPQYTDHELSLSAGRHVLAVLLHYSTLPTRIMNGVLPPFFFAEWDGPAPLSWKFCRLDAFDHALKKRISVELDYVDWCDRRLMPENWTHLAFDDTAWDVPREAREGELPPFTEDPTRPVKNLYRALTPIASGTLTESFGYEKDEISARFLLREQDGTSLPPQGIYRRYDLGQVGLWHPCFRLNVPSGSTVEISLSEQLFMGRVAPYISLTLGETCNMTHFTAAGGDEEFLTLTPHGGRYMELHILTDPDKVGRIQVLEEGVFQRTFFADPVGSLESGNETLDKIYQICVNTLRGCTEDAVCDCPLRERGQWIGDSAVVGLLTAAYAYGEMSVIRKSLREATFCTDQNGVLPALFPGQPCYFHTYALAWVRGLWDYYCATGDRTLLSEVFPALERFMAYTATVFDKETGAFTVDVGFIDWGYRAKQGKPIPFASFLYESALDRYEKIAACLGNSVTGIKEQREAVRQTLTAFKDEALSAGAPVEWHDAVSLILAGVVTEEEKQKLADGIESFMLSCFPNNESAPRLSDPGLLLTQIITPYFCHYAFTALIKAGRYPFVLRQIEQCWGYMLKNGDNTCLEVFDPRWSHCHQWSTCPLWLLSTATLGLTKREDLGKNVLELTREDQPLVRVRGTVPLASGRKVTVEWQKRKNAVELSLTPEEDVRLLLADGTLLSVPAGKTETITLSYGQAP